MHLLSSELGSKSQFPLKRQPNQQQPNSELVVNVDYVTPAIIFHRSTRPLILYYVSRHQSPVDYLFIYVSWIIILELSLKTDHTRYYRYYSKGRIRLRTWLLAQDIKSGDLFPSPLHITQPSSKQKKKMTVTVINNLKEFQSIVRLQRLSQSSYTLTRLASPSDRRGYPCVDRFLGPMVSSLRSHLT